MQMYKVFTENQLLIFTKENNIQKNSTFFNCSSIENLESVLTNIDSENTEIQLLVADNSSIEYEVDCLFSKHKKITAAGGIVLKDSKIAVIFRNEKWDLPKGHVDFGETIEAAALREVKEETGIIAQLSEKIGCTYHTYVYNNQLVLKTTHWFEMISINDSLIQPQLEEGITAIEWFDLSDLSLFYSNTYASLANLMKHYLELHSKK
jgi:8-oxo-dGTP pyrophosphatase MutT (NUDIX family)